MGGCASQYQKVSFGFSLLVALLMFAFRLPSPTDRDRVVRYMRKVPDAPTRGNWVPPLVSMEDKGGKKSTWAYIREVRVFLNYGDLLINVFLGLIERGHGGTYTPTCSF
jgi:hypothetical protein